MTNNTNNTYVCAVCQQTFEKALTDDAAEEQLAYEFPGFDTDDCELVCDDCFNDMGFKSGEGCLTDHERNK